MPYSISEMLFMIKKIIKFLDKTTILKILSIICIIMGAYFLLNSTKIGLKITEDNSYKVYLITLKSNIENWRIFGLILLTVGLYLVFKKKL